jgi:L-2-hydroxycarboxylate dehydrogenase (NAD+)
MNEITLPYTQLRQFAVDIFKKMNCPEADAQLAANVLLSADLRGIDSHGVARLSGYVRLWEAKRINSKAQHKSCTRNTQHRCGGWRQVVWDLWLRPKPWK